MLLKKIRVTDTVEFNKRRALFTSLGMVFRVHFSAEFSVDESDGIVSFRQDDIPENYNKPALTFITSHIAEQPVKKNIHFKQANLYDVDFSNKSFNTTSLELREGLNFSGDIIASQDNNILWLKRKLANVNHYFSAIPPKELDEGNSLKDLFSSEDFISLFPLLVLIKDVLGESLVLPERKASFIVDDPNMHADTYGYINYRTLIAEAKEHNYHVGIATIPLDNFFASRRTVKLFSENKKYVSPIIHGNNHTKAEFLMHNSEETIFTLNQILHRIGNFKSKYNLEIQDVLTAPHGMISREMLKSVSYYNFAGVVNARPFPWYPFGTDIKKVKEAKFFSRWFPADFIDSTPIIPRMLDVTDVPFKLFMHIPTIFTLHHWDIKNGYSFLKEKADYVNGLSHVKWQSMGEIFRKNYALYNLDNEFLTVQLMSKNIEVDLPSGYKKVRFRLVNNSANGQNLSIKVNGTKFSLHKNGPDEYFSTDIYIGGEDKLNVTLKNYSDKNNTGENKAKSDFYPYFRRLLTETRDRIRPFTKK